MHFWQHNKKKPLLCRTQGGLNMVWSIITQYCIQSGAIIMQLVFSKILTTESGWGLGAFLSWWLPSTVWEGPLIYLWPPLGGAWIILPFRIWGLYTACWVRFLCCHELWPTSVNHPFSSVALLAWRKTVEENFYPCFRLVLQNFASPGCFPYILFYSFLSPYFLLVGLLLQYVALFQSRELAKV